MIDVEMGEVSAFINRIIIKQHQILQQKNLQQCCTIAWEKSMPASIGISHTIIILLTYTIPGTGIPVWKLGVVVIELIILGILVVLIISDLKVIRWFKDKKKSCL